MNNAIKFVQMAMQNGKCTQNPMFNNAISLMEKNDTKGLEQMARNLCKEKGVDIEDVIKKIGI